jgi:hypothetical protein
MTTIIEITAIRPPKEGKKVATVVASSGQAFEIWPDKAAKLSEGARYEVEVEEREWNSRTIRKITKAKPADMAPAANGNARTIPISTAAPPDAELAFVSGLLNTFIAAGHVKLDARELIQATTTLRMLWSASFGPGLNTFRASEAGQMRN